MTQLCRLRHAVAALVALLMGAMLAVEARQLESPKPGPEFDIYKKLEGTWEEYVKATFAPGQPAEGSKGKATWKLECGGLWLVGDFKGGFEKMPFQGKSLESYDAKKKKYVSVWVDSMGPTPMLSEGTYDKEKKTLTML